MPDFTSEAWLAHERAIVSRAASGDRRAFDAFFDLFYPHVTSSIRARVRNDALADDAIAHAFTAAYDYLPRFDLSRGGSFWFWLHRTAMNKVTDLKREHARSGEITEAVLELAAPDRQAEIDHAIDLPKQIARARALVARLPTEQNRTVIQLFVVEQHSRQRCAEIMGLSASAFAQALSRALEAFRTLWDEGAE